MMKYRITNAASKYNKLKIKYKIMEETLFDPDGNPVAYIDYDDESTIYLWDGSPVAYISEENQIYGFNGRHIGWFEGGVIRNLIGEINGFNSQKLPVFAKFEPFKAFKKFKPFKAFKEFAKFKAFNGLSRSNTSLAQFLISGKL